MIAALPVTYIFEGKTIVVRRARRPNWRGFEHPEDVLYFQPHHHRNEGVTRYHPHTKETRAVEEEIVISAGTKERGKKWSTPPVLAKTGRMIDQTYDFKTPPAGVSSVLGVRPAIIEMTRPELLAVLEGVLTERMTFEWDYESFPHLMWFFAEVTAKPKATAEEIRAIGAKSRLMWIESETQRLTDQLARARAAARIEVSSAIPQRTGSLFE